MVSSQLLQKHVTKFCTVLIHFPEIYRYMYWSMFFLASPPLTGKTGKHYRCIVSLQPCHNNCHPDESSLWQWRKWWKELVSGQYLANSKALSMLSPSVQGTLFSNLLSDPQSVLWSLPIKKIYNYSCKSACCASLQQYSICINEKKHLIQISHKTNTMSTF